MSNKQNDTYNEAVAEFLPKNEEIPSGLDKYMKLEQGENKFRVLGSPVIGYEGWKTQEDGSKRPVRVPKGETMDIDLVDDPEEIKYFWALPVWNYKTEKIQILMLTQKTILRTILGLSRSKDWGSPLGYDIAVIREGEGMKTEYNVIPSPHKELDKKIEKTWKETKINLELLFENKDPWENEVTQSDMDKIDEEIDFPIKK